MALYNRNEEFQVGIDWAGAESSEFQNGMFINEVPGTNLIESRTGCCGIPLVLQCGCDMPSILGSASESCRSHLNNNNNWHHEGER